MRSRSLAAVRRHPFVVAVTSAVLLALIVLGAYLFQPWRLFTSSTLDEAVPGAETVSPAVSGAPEATPPLAAGSPADSAAPITPVPQPTTVVLATGAFVSQEHPTSGTASLLRLPDGSLVLRLENLASSDGPDVKVWLSSQAAGGDWFKYRSGRYVDLGAIRATHGNQNYAVPPGADLAGLRTVVLWCDRFSVAFGSAPLAYDAAVRRGGGSEGAEVR